MSAGSCSPQVTSGNVGLAFGLVTAAGLSTAVGAALAFVMPYSSGGKNLFLAASLGVAAGVMIYVSFVEIFTAKSIPALGDCVGEQYAYLYGTLCFFAGVFLTWLFDQGLHFLEHKFGKSRKKGSADGHADGPPIALDALRNVVESVATGEGADMTQDFQNNAERGDQLGREMGDELPMRTVGAATTASGSSPSIEVTLTEDASNSGAASAYTETPVSSDLERNSRVAAAVDEPIVIDQDVGHDGHMVADIYREHGHDARALTRMGMFAGIALAAHNFPEGLATFVAVLDDPSVGVSVAVAIAIHNIPEGICVAMPIYYATGSRKKAVFWATLSGLTELIGAFLGWVVLRKVFSQVVYGVLFGIVAGMMVYISIKELLPTAHRYDPEDKVTTLSLIGGMIIMAVSLVLFMF